MKKKKYPIINIINTNEVFLPVTENEIQNVLPNYIVSNYGRAYNKTTGNFIGWKAKNGYINCTFAVQGGKNKKRGIHIIEKRLFDPIDNYDSKSNIVNHLDGVKNNNVLSNLEWTTPSGNMQHAVNTGLLKVRGEDNSTAKLTKQEVEEICELIETGKYSDTEIAGMFNVSRGTINDIHNGTTWIDYTKDYDLSVRKPNVKYGDESRYHVLSEKQVHEICKMIESGEYFDFEIADMYGVNSGTIGEIHRRETWIDVSKEYDFSKRKRINGENNPNNKLSADDVHEICRMIESGNYTDVEISKKFGVTSTTIGRIHRRESWTSISDNYNI